MKVNFLLILILFWVMFSCKKEKTESQQDEIVYKNIVPKKEMQSVRIYTSQSNPVCTTTIPIPSDSSITYDLDLDSDQIPDFRIMVTHSKFNSGYCGHCDKFTYNISIEGLSSGDSVAADSPQYPKLRLFSDADLVNNNNAWFSRVDILLLEGCALPFQTDFEDGYIGVKMNNNYGYIKIGKMSNNGITLSEHGFNKTANVGIKCGQTS